MKNSCLSKGVTLVELAIGTAVTGVVALGVTMLYVNSNQSQMNSNLKSQAEQQMRAFLEATKKHLSLARNPYSNSAGSFLNASFQNRNCSFFTTNTPTKDNCGNPALTFSKLIIDRYGDPAQPSSYFTETITTECLATPSNIKIDAALKAEIIRCTPCTLGQLPVIRIRRSNANGVVMRFSGALESQGSANLADDGITVASSLCATHEPLLTPTDPQSFQTVTIRLKTLVKQNQNQVRALELSAAALLPKPISGGVRVLSTQ